MHKNIFLASYPKSGNTWLRSIIGNFYNFDKEFSLNDLKSIPLLSNALKCFLIDSKGINFKSFRLNSLSKL